MPDTIVEFISARLDEDEQIARAATQGQWRHDPSKHNRPPYSTEYEEAVFTGPRGADAVCIAGTGPSDDPQSMRDAAHIAHYGPARMLADIESKRAILEVWSRAYQNPIDADTFAGPYWDRVRGNARWTLRKLAAPYVDHPDYRQEWNA